MTSHLYVAHAENFASEEKENLSFEDFLMHEGHLSPQQVRFLIYERRIQKKDTATLLVEMGLLSQGALGELFSAWKGESSPCFSLQERKPELHDRFTRAQAEALEAIPFDVRGETLMVAMIHPYNCITRDEILYCFGELSRIEGYPILASDFYALLDRIYGEKGFDTDPQGPEQTEVKVFLHHLFSKALKSRASDIHFEPGERLVRVRLRLDGVLHPTLVFHRDLWMAATTRLKMMAHLDIVESRLPQFGRFSMIMEGRRLDCRLSTHPTQYGEAIVIRLLDQNKTLHRLENLGFSFDLQEKMKRIIQQPQGLFIVTGPTGSGKTTTLYALLHALNAQEKKIVTLEDPIEYRLFHVQQTEICETAGLTFAQGIRSLLRQDPDVILVGEIRDSETALMALRAALTGHLVLTTLHTHDALGALSRLKDLEVPMGPLAEVLLGVMAQRLMRLTCSVCHTQGCPLCAFTGYYGRQGLAEMFAMDDTLKHMVTYGASRQEMVQYLIQKEYIPMIQNAQYLTQNKKTTPQEIKRVLGDERL